MARPTTGSVIEHKGKDGRTYRALRFVAYGKRRHISLGPVSAEDAERELAHVIADVQRGRWQPPNVIEPPPEPDPVPTFHAFAEEWWTLTRDQLAQSTQADYSWRLQVHLIPYFGAMALDRISYDTVERYLAAKLAEDDPLSARSINMTVTLLGAILERAVERELIPRNPAQGKGRRVRQRTPQRSYLDAAAHIVALLDAAGELDRQALPERKHVERRAMIATLTFAGLRIGELCALRWRDVDLAQGWLTVGEAKTDAGRRKVKIRGRPARRAAGGPRSLPGCPAGRLRVRHARRRADEPEQLPQPGARGVRQARRRAPGGGGPAAAAGQDHTALAAPDVLLAALRAGRGPRHRHGRNGAHRLRAGAARLPAGDAPRRGREGAAAGGRRGGVMAVDGRRDEIKAAGLRENGAA